MSNQDVAQVLQAPLPKSVFLTKKPQDLQTLGEALVEQKQEEFIYVCLYTRSCKIFEKKPEDVTLPLENQQFTMEFLALENMGSILYSRHRSGSDACNLNFLTFWGSFFIPLNKGK